MITFPNAKINLGLNIVEKRPDGYHNLETIFYPVPVEDALEVNILNEGNEKFRLHQAGLEIEGEAENNLVVKAYKLLDAEFNLPPVDIHLFKHIPSGAGLGGGSSDAAYMLKLLNEKFNLELTNETLEECRQIGSRLRLFHSEYSNVCRRNRKYLLSYLFIPERLSDCSSKTGYFCFHSRSFCADKTASPASPVEGSDKVSHGRMEGTDGK